jgi:hypothetical protein
VCNNGQCTLYKVADVGNVQSSVGGNITLVIFSEVTGCHYLVHQEFPFPSVWLNNAVCIIEREHLLHYVCYGTRKPV